TLVRRVFLGVTRVGENRSTRSCGPSLHYSSVSYRFTASRTRIDANPPRPRFSATTAARASSADRPPNTGEALILAAAGGGGHAGRLRRRALWQGHWGRRHTGP